jgi:hypothetical protein
MHQISRLVLMPGDIVYNYALGWGCNCGTKQPAMFRDAAAASPFGALATDLLFGLGVNSFLGACMPRTAASEHIVATRCATDMTTASATLFEPDCQILQMTRSSTVRQAQHARFIQPEGQCPADVTLIELSSTCVPCCLSMEMRQRSSSMQSEMHRRLCVAVTGSECFFGLHQLR